MSSMQVEQAVERAKRLVALYERRMITDSTLVSEIAGLVPADNIHDVLQILPPQVTALMREWAKSLPDEDTRRVVFWPVSERVRLSFKEWLREQEEQEKKSQNGG